MHSLPRGQPSQDRKRGSGRRLFGLVLLSAAQLLAMSACAWFVRLRRCSFRVHLAPVRVSLDSKGSRRAFASVLFLCYVYILNQTVYNVKNFFKIFGLFFKPCILANKIRG
jgi:hypothetical protein